MVVFLVVYIFFVSYVDCAIVDCAFFQGRLKIELVILLMRDSNKAKVQSFDFMSTLQI